MIYVIDVQLKQTEEWTQIVYVGKDLGKTKEVARKLAQKYYNVEVHERELDILDWESGALGNVRYWDEKEDEE
ncbi:hypothetical protein [Listeria seeligeri]|uniref:hypothetical protein n=1 Tax=Listeria seeligeri TaxID=1640 RepID=UPI0016290EEC|nr:hypothetical protein [Listeria seeligeri]MBC1934589.1 hypothetical protein [Listeria seeligeri]